MNRNKVNIFNLKVTLTIIVIVIYLIMTGGPLIMFLFKAPDMLNAAVPAEKTQFWISLAVMIVESVIELVVLFIARHFIIKAFERKLLSPENTNSHSEIRIGMNKSFTVNREVNTDEPNVTRTKYTMTFNGKPKKIYEETAHEHISPTYDHTLQEHQTEAKISLLCPKCGESFYAPVRDKYTHCPKCGKKMPVA